MAKKFKQYIMIELDEGSNIEVQSYPEFDYIQDIKVFSTKNGEDRVLGIMNTHGRSIEIITKEIESEE